MVPYLLGRAQAERRPAGAHESVIGRAGGVAVRCSVDDKVLSPYEVCAVVSLG
jgi:hypothetical protein